MFKTFSVLLVVGTVIGCSARVDTRGNLPDPKVVAKLEPGKSTRNLVAQRLGSPSTIAAFDDETWLYISERTETLAFFEPEVKERQVLVVSFDKKGVLKKLQSLGVDAGKRLEHVGRVTPTHGNELTIIEQMVGNFQRFEKRNAQSQSPAPTQ